MAEIDTPDGEILGLTLGLSLADGAVTAVAFLLQDDIARRAVGSPVGPMKQTGGAVLPSTRP